MSNSPSTLETETDGNVADAENNMHRQHRAYKILIFGDERERTLALTQIIAMPSVLVAINIGAEMVEKIILNSKAARRKRLPRPQNPCVPIQEERR